MAEKKHSVLALLDILINYSDENNILSTKDIMNYLSTIHNIDIERRTLYSNIEILEQAGYLISKYNDNGKGYFLEERQFDKGEILLLCNAIHASHFISIKQSDQLINKLLKTLSKNDRNEFKSKVYLPNNQKTKNNELIYNIEVVSEAIRDRRVIEFEYLTYNYEKQLINKRDKTYIVEPRYIVYADSRAYLIATNKDYYDFTHYRLDRMHKVHLLNEKVKKLPNDLDAYEYSKNRLFMYGGEIIKVTFKCHKNVLNHMIDTFGDEIKIKKLNDDCFVINVKTNYQGAKYFSQQYLDSIEVLEPSDLREEIKDDIKKALKNYK